MKTKKMSFKGKVGKNAKSQQSESSGFGYLTLPKGLQRYSPKPGSKGVLLDFLPYLVSDPRHPDKDEKDDIAMVGNYWYRRPFFTHKNIGTGNDSVVCLGSIGKKCPICEYRAKRQKEGADKEELQALKQSKRVLYVVIPLNSTEYEKKIHIFDISHFNFQELLNDELEENSDYEIFPDLEEGLSLKIRWNAETMGSSKPFAQAGKIEFEERKKPYKESILDEVPDLDKVLKILTYAELDAKFLEMENDEDKGEEKEEPRKRKAVEKEEEEEEEQEEKPIQRKRKPEPEPEPEPEGVELSWEDLLGMKESVLIKLCKENGLDTDPDDYDDDVKALRKAIAKEIGVQIPKTTPAPAPIAEKDKCHVCKGTGKIPNGRTCGVCAGTGVKQKAKPVEEEETKKPVSRGSKKNTPECPVEDGVFGETTDDFKECNNCDLWDACLDAKEGK